MVEAGGSLGLAQHAGAALGADGSIAQDLDGHIALQEGVVGAVHNSHAPFAKLLIQAITVAK